MSCSRGVVEVYSMLLQATSTTNPLRVDIVSEFYRLLKTNDTHKKCETAVAKAIKCLQSCKYF